MEDRKGKCTNFGNCMNADRSVVLDVPEGKDFVCPDCGRPLNPVEVKRAGSRSPVPIILLILLLAAGASWYLLRHRKSSATEGGVAPVSDTAAPVATGNLILRLHGSNTVGAQLAPALAQAYLRQQGAQDVKAVPGHPDEVTVQGTVSGAPQVIEIAAHGSATAFTDLAAGTCDIGLASRKIKPDEVAKLSSLGDMTSPASEHVLGLDGVAVIVNRANPVSSLSTDQLAGVFSGQIADWSGVSGSGGAIKVYSRDDPRLPLSTIPLEMVRENGVWKIDAWRIVVHRDAQMPR